MLQGGQASGDGAPEADERRRQTLSPVATVIAQDMVCFDSDDVDHGRRKWLRRSCEAWSSPSMVATRGMAGSIVLRWPTTLIHGLDGVLRWQPPPILCLCIRLLVEPILRFFSLIMMYDVDIYATFCNNLCFARYQSSNFCVYGVETKVPFKICAHALETHTTCHNFRST
jgi:hypothetical protein